MVLHVEVKVQSEMVYFTLSTTVKICLAELFFFFLKKVIWDGVRALCSQSLSSRAGVVNILCRRHGGCLGLLASAGDAEAPW